MFFFNWAIFSFSKPFFFAIFGVLLIVVESTSSRWKRTLKHPIHLFPGNVSSGKLPCCAIKISIPRLPIWTINENGFSANFGPGQPGNSWEFLILSCPVHVWALANSLLAFEVTTRRFSRFFHCPQTFVDSSAIFPQETTKTPSQTVFPCGNVQLQSQSQTYHYQLWYLDVCIPDVCRRDWSGQSSSSVDESSVRLSWRDPVAFWSLLSFRVARMRTVGPLIF